MWNSLVGHKEMACSNNSWVALLWGNFLRISLLGFKETSRGRRGYGSGEENGV
jgi:hypothetical protein